MTSVQLITAAPVCTIARATKHLVDQLLALNIKNRHVRTSVVARYQRFMERGLWTLTNQGIGISSTGFLIDGQHRLRALRAADYPQVDLLIVTGLSDEALAAVDMGVNRTPRDYLAFVFDRRVSALTGAVLRTIMLAQKDFTETVKFEPREYADALERFGPSIEAIFAVPHNTRLPGAVLSALVDAHEKGYAQESVDFCTALSSGEMLDRDHPALVLRNWLAATRGHAGQTTMIERFRKTIRAMTAFIERKPITKLYRTRSPIPRQPKPIAGDDEAPALP